MLHASASGRNRLPVTAIVLAKDEARNLRECLASVADRLEAIIVVDSLSTDGTAAIANAFGARVISREWRNYADQFQWALDHLPISTPWIMRLDADERWTPQGLDQLGALFADPDTAGINVRMKIYFMGRFLKHGGMYPNEFLRVFRKGMARIEQRWMDEHIDVAGRTVSSGIDVIESNYDRQVDITAWTNKHNAYATREAVDVLIARWKISRIDTIADPRGGSTARRRWLKERVYARLPLFLRALLYWAYRYVFRLGFLDGMPGFIFSVLQAFWYRFLVDVKVYQVEQLARKRGCSITEAIRESLAIDLGRDETAQTGGEAGLD